MEDIIRFAVSLGYSITVGPNNKPDKSGQYYLGKVITLIKDADVMFFSVPAYGDMRVVMMNTFMKERIDHPLYQAILENRGSKTTVNLNQEMIENVSELTHTALRKVGDSGDIAMLYSAIQSLPNPVWTYIVNATKAALTNVWQSPRPYTRYQLGMILKQRWTNAIEAFEQEEFNRTAQRYTFLDFGKEDEQKLAMLVFNKSCENLSDEEWTFCIGAYLHEYE